MKIRYRSSPTISRVKNTPIGYGTRKISDREIIEKARKWKRMEDPPHDFRNWIKQYIDSIKDLDDFVFGDNIEEFLLEDPWYHEKLIEWLKEKGYEIDEENQDLLQYIPLDVIKEFAYTYNTLDDYLEDRNMARLIWDQMKDKYIEDYVLEHAENPKEVFRKLIEEGILNPYNTDKAIDIYIDDIKKIKKKIKEKVEKGELIRTWERYPIEENPYAIAQRLGIKLD